MPFFSGLHLELVRQKQYTSPSSSDLYTLTLLSVFMTWPAITLIPGRIYDFFVSLTVICRLFLLSPMVLALPTVKSFRDQRRDLGMTLSFCALLRTDNEGNSSGTLQEGCEGFDKL